MFGEEIVVRSTHAGLLFEDGRFIKVVSAGRHKLMRDGLWRRILRKPVSSIISVDTRQRELTIKGQEILTADKVAIRVSILVQYQVTDPKAAVLTVDSFVDRIYSDVQLAARRSLAGMTLEEILTNRKRLSEEILQEVQDGAVSYGVEIRRADVKDLIFPGNLQDVMNRVLQAERLSQAQLIEARTQAEKARIEAEAQSAIDKEKASAHAEAARLRAEADAEVKRINVEAEVQSVREREKTAAIFQNNPALLRLEELQTLQRLAFSANAQLYISFDKPIGTKMDRNDK